jgi:hypothetical protein
VTTTGCGQAARPRPRLTPSRPPFKREVEVPVQSVHPLSTTSPVCSFVLSVCALYSLSLYSLVAPVYPLCCLYTPLLPPSLFSGTSLYWKLPVQPCRAVCYFTQLSLCLCLKNRDTSLLVLIVLKVLLGPYHPSGAALITPVPPLLFSGTVSYLSFSCCRLLSYCYRFLLYG